MKKLNWSINENLRRIAVNLVRYDYISQKDAKILMRYFKKYVQETEVSLDEMRAISSNLSRNATDRVRDRTAAQIVMMAKFIAEKKA